MSDEWFTRFGKDRTTLWGFSIEGLTEAQALELDRCLRGVVGAFEAELRRRAG